MYKSALRDQLIIDEGLMLKPYRDTVGKLTIGIGRNLDDVGISRDEAMMLLDNDIESVCQQVDKSFPWVWEMDEPRQLVLFNMAFNMGITKLSQFKNTLSAMASGDYEKAAAGMVKSLWFKQVGARARRLVQIMYGKSDKEFKAWLSGMI